MLRLKKNVISTTQARGRKNVDRAFVLCASVSVSCDQRSRSCCLEVKYVHSVWQAQHVVSANW